VGGLQSGTPTGYASAGLSAAQLASRNGAFGSNTSGVNSGIGYAGNLLGAYQGFKTGGVAGDAQGAANLASMGARSGAFGSASGAIGKAAGLVGAGLSTYNTIKNWQSGNTGSDALNGAETGAAWGSYFGPVGTLVGAVAGGAIGAASSAFGGGRPDQETTNWNSLVSQASKNPQILQQLSPSQAVQSLAGIMDAKNNTPGHSTPLELQFGRMGESSLITQMAQQVNSAVAAGKLPASATPQQIYQQVVTPWLQSKNAYVPENAIVSSNGSRNNGSIDALLTQLIAQWQSGALNSHTPVGVSGQTIPGLPTFGNAPLQVSTPSQAPGGARAAPQQPWSGTVASRRGMLRFQ
jgi:hypothetical protein